MDLISKLLRWNPEYYTIWNYRRLLLQHFFSEYRAPDGSDQRVTIDLIADDLTFLLPLLRKFPKCYWIWNYRLWLLEQASRLLTGDEARNFWQQELMLASKMLSLDSRNFMGWGYRRTVVAALENSQLSPDRSAAGLVAQEFEYTTKMINSNLSNFSAWHNRSKLIPRLLNERNADHAARLKFLDEGKLSIVRIHAPFANAQKRARADTTSALGRLGRPIALVLPPFPDGQSGCCPYFQLLRT